MNANVIEVKPFNITKIELVALRGPKGETGYPTPEQVQTAVDAWLEDHPEATTTVQDGAITTVKLHDNAVTEDKLSESLQSLLITDTASGSIASFSDGSDGINVRELKVHIEPVQSGSGDPSPSNIRPITGWENVKVTRTGKNLANGTFGNQVPSINNGQMVSANGWSTPFIKIDNTKEYTFSFSGSVGRYVLFYDSSQNFLGLGTNVTNGYHLSSYNKYSQAEYIKLRGDGGSEQNPQLQLELGSTATPYEPYTAAEVTIPLGSTVYGGTLDVTTGVLTVDRRIISTSDFTTITSGTSSGGLHWIDTLASIDATELGPAISNMLERKDGTDGWGSTTPAFAIRAGVGSIRVYCKEETKAEFETVYDGLQICFTILNPTTVQLTAQQMTTLLGQNNVFADAGDVDVTYVADTKLYIAKMIANALNA